MPKEEGLTIVKQNRFNRIVNYFKNIFFKDKIRKNNIYESINVLERQLEELKQQDIDNKMIEVSIKTTENRIALLNYRASLKETNKKSRTIIVE